MHDSGAAWKADYRVWLIGDTAVAIGSGMFAFAFPLLALAVSGSAATAGVIGFIQGAGALLGLLPGGIVADRYSRKTVRFVGASLGAAFQGVLAVLFISGLVNAYVLAALAFTDAIRRGLCSPSSESLLKQLVPRKELPSKFAVNSGRDAAVDIAAAPVAGAVMSLQAALPVLFSAVGNVVLAVFTLFIRPVDAAAGGSSGKGAGGALRDLHGAVKWILSQRIRVHAIAVGAFVNFASGGAITALTLFLASEGVPYFKVGLVTTGLSASVLVGAFLASPLGRRIRGGTIVAIALGILVLSVVAIAVRPSFIVALVSLMVLGLSIAPLIASTQGFLAQATPEGLLGRVDAVSMLGSSIIMPFAPAVAGIGVETWGIRATLSVFALASLVALLSVLMIRGGLRELPVLGN